MAPLAILTRPAPIRGGTETGPAKTYEVISLEGIGRAVTF